MCINSYGETIGYYRELYSNVSWSSLYCLDMCRAKDGFLSNL